MRALVPVLAIAGGAAGLLACLIAFLRSRGRGEADSGTIPRTGLNRDIDVARYKPTSDPILFLEKELPDHPFKIGDGGILCSICLINSRLKLPSGAITIHEHACTVIRKEWKIVICREAGQAEYFISLDRTHLRKGR